MPAISHVVRAALVTTLALTLGGCAAGSDSSAASGRPSPEGASASADPDVSRIVIASDAISIIGEPEGDVERFDYYGPSGDVVAALSERLGEPMVDVPQGDGTDGPTTYAWSALRLVDYAGPGDEATATADFVVTAAGANVGPIRVETASGVAVGDPIDEVDLGDEPVIEATGVDEAAVITVTRVDVRPATVGDGQPITLGVQLVSRDGAVMEFTAPTANLDG